MDSAERIYKDAMLKKSTKGASRTGDPRAWSCLSDEQRDIICEWYYGRCLEHYREDKARSEHIERKRNNAMYFAISPFAFAYSLQRNPVGLWMLIEAAAAFIIYGLVVCVFNEAYGVMDEGTTTAGRIFAAIRSAALSFIVTYIVLYAVGAL